MSRRTFAVGTRRSPLARAQTELVVRALQRRAPRARFVARPMQTGGDRDRSLGASPDFTDALDAALVDGRIDLAVHSAKDLPLELRDGLALAACPPRADPRDCLVMNRQAVRGALPHASRIGSSSLRRRAQLLRWRPDLRVVELRGNVDSRLARVRSGGVDAAIVAVAGLRRLGRLAEANRILPLTHFLPAPAQGALAVLTRQDDAETRRLVARLDHGPSRAAVLAERAFARALGGDCQTPIGALATVGGRRLRLTGEVLSLDGRRRLRARTQGRPEDATALGDRLGHRILDAGGRLLLGRPPGGAE